MAVIGILIKLDSPGPVFYRQVRVGLRARPYMMWKFRSMFTDAEKGGARWASAKRCSNLACGLVFAKMAA